MRGHTSLRWPCQQRLAASAEAIVNCRILPGYSREEIRQQLIHIFNEPKVSVRYVANNREVQDTAPDEKAVPPTALQPEVMQPLTKLVAGMWPGIPVVPEMEAGASDGKITSAAGLPTYGLNGIAIDIDDVRAHGKDERLGVDSYYHGVEFYYRYLRILSGGKE